MKNCNLGKSRVALLQCTDYDEDKVYKTVREGLDLLGGIEKFVGKEEKILLKPNLLKRAAPDQAITTHPSVFRSVARILREDGYNKIFYGDSPGNGNPLKASKASGIAAAAKEFEIEQADFNQGEKVSFPQGKVAKEFIMSRGVMEADAIINVCKMKTHALQRITGAVKNMFGCVYGFNKGLSHARYPSADRFAKMLCDLHVMIKPRLHIMDGIVAMEGNGPSSGSPVKMNVILISQDPVALDSVFCRLIHLNPESVPTNVNGEAWGLGNCHDDNIEIITPEGEKSIEEIVKQYGKPDFDVYRGDIKKAGFHRVEWLMKLIRQRPYVVEKKCIRCGICVKSCPVEGKAIKLDKEKGTPPKYDYDKCIRCYCCQEMCPKKAIEVKTPFLRKILDKLAGSH
ncbi:MULTISPECIES: DUF362 domain-containing protein [Clostridium]|jgi:uncharacterized protein (DUF362 family)/Pyruvate/2-oxoacid:ferredoxin oxidoreductase delta subunit|uniref:Ferredoxin n=1 Tax=Clostridium lapidicellarium TaxID=3240931 RepID=A0ABV4E0C3_9CLOT|nr:DUF362 domain-containing protein [uncultured Clostridium sp.]NLU06796.1 DUF362 domain-containing protein [Clostridiales bacterium]